MCERHVSNSFYVDPDKHGGVRFISALTVYGGNKNERLLLELPYALVTRILGCLVVEFFSAQDFFLFFLGWLLLLLLLTTISCAFSGVAGLL